MKTLQDPPMVTPPCVILHRPTGDRHTVTLRFLRNELLQDIQNAAYAEGDILPEEEGQHGRHLTQDITQEGNVEVVTRCLASIHAAAVELLFPFTKKAVVEDGAISDQYREPDDYTITLSLPSDFSQTTVHAIKHLVHRWMVCGALARWLSITSPKSADKWAAEALASQEQINALKHSRLSQTLQRRGYPF